MMTMSSERVSEAVLNKLSSQTRTATSSMHRSLGRIPRFNTTLTKVNSITIGSQRQHNAFIVNCWVWIAPSIAVWICMCSLIIKYNNRNSGNEREVPHLLVQPLYVATIWSNYELTTLQTHKQSSMNYTNSLLFSQIYYSCQRLKSLFPLINPLIINCSKL